MRAGDHKSPSWLRAFSIGNLKSLSQMRNVSRYAGVGKEDSVFFVEKGLEARCRGSMFRVPSVEGTRKTGAGDIRRRQRLGSFDGSFSEIFLGNLRKKTCGDGRNSHRLPSLRLLLSERKSARHAKEAKARFFLRILSGCFFGMFG